MLIELFSYQHLSAGASIIHLVTLLLDCLEVCLVYGFLPNVFYQCKIALICSSAIAIFGDEVVCVLESRSFILRLCLGDNLVMTSAKFAMLIDKREQNLY